MIMNKGRSKSIRFNDENDDDDADEDTPPTRSRSRKARSRVAFNEPSKSMGAPTNLKSALKDAGDGAKSTPGLQLGRIDRSRGSSKSRSQGWQRSAGARSVSSNNRVFKDPGPGIGG